MAAAGVVVRLAFPPRARAALDRLSGWLAIRHVGTPRGCGRLTVDARSPLVAGGSGWSAHFGESVLTFLSAWLVIGLGVGIAFGLLGQNRCQQTLGGAQPFTQRPDLVVSSASSRSRMLRSLTGCGSSDSSSTHSAGNGSTSGDVSSLTAIHSSRKASWSPPPSASTTSSSGPHPGTLSQRSTFPAVVWLMALAVRYALTRKLGSPLCRCSSCN